jgi:hypothetical protein
LRQGVEVVERVVEEVRGHACAQHVQFAEALAVGQLGALLVLHQLLLRKVYQCGEADGQQGVQDVVQREVDEGRVSRVVRLIPQAGQQPLITDPAQHEEQQHAADEAR